MLRGKAQAQRNNISEVSDGQFLFLKGSRQRKDLPLALGTGLGKVKYKDPKLRGRQKMILVQALLQ